MKRILSEEKKFLNWKPKTNLEEGIRKTYNWHIDNIKWLKKIRVS